MAVLKALLLAACALASAEERRVRIVPAPSAPSPAPEPAAPSPGWTPSASGGSGFRPSGGGRVGIVRDPDYQPPRFRRRRRHRGYWWAYDPFYRRWNYWHDGYWWWRGPSATFVYVDDEYRPYEDAPPAPAEPPAPPADVVVNSPDGRRAVQLTGADRQAFLHERSGPELRLVRYLGAGVERARFSGGTAGKPLRVLLDYKDGSFALLDEDGRPADGPAQPAPVPGR